jgi:hypothetical protein
MAKKKTTTRYSLYYVRSRGKTKKAENYKQYSRKDKAIKDYKGRTKAASLVGVKWKRNRAYATTLRKKKGR